MKIFLETPRLYITVPTLADLADLYSLQSDPDVMKYVGTGVRTLIEVRMGLQKAIQHYEKYGFSLGSVFKKEDNVFIGRAGLIYLAFDDTQKDIEFGYALHKLYWGKGYATELSIKLIEWAFKELPVEKLVAVINPENERSRRVLKKVNMRYVGKDLYHRHEVERYEIYKGEER